MPPAGNYGFESRREIRRVTQDLRDAERMNRSGVPQDAVSGTSDSQSVYVRVTGPFDLGYHRYPGKFVFRNTDVQDHTSAGAWYDGDDCMIEEVGSTSPSLVVSTDPVAGPQYVGLVAGSTPDDYALVEVSAGGGGGGGDGDCGPGCGWVAGLATTDCLRMTVLSASGACSCITTGQAKVLRWTGARDWAPSSPPPPPLAVNLCSGKTASAVFHGDGCTGPCLVFTVTEEDFSTTDYELTLDCCGANYAIFSGPGATVDGVLCSGVRSPAGPLANTFRMKVEWVICPNPDYDGPGWYCEGITGCTGSDTRVCVLLSTDPGTGVTLCSGPHADEATCNAACTSPPPPPPVTTGCCPGYEIPGRLFLTIQTACCGAVTFPLNLTHGTVPWEWTATGTFCTHPFTFVLRCRLVSAGPPAVYSWGYDITGTGLVPYTDGAIGGSCNPVFLSGTNINNGFCDDPFAEVLYTVSETPP